LASHPDARTQSDAVNALTVGAVGVAYGHLVGIVLGLRQTFGERFVPSFGFDHGEFGIAVFENVVGAQWIAAPHLPSNSTFDTTGRDEVITPNPTAVHHTPSRGFQCGIDVFGSGFGFVHSVLRDCPAKAWCSSDFFSASSAASFCW